MTHICVSKVTIIVSDNGLSPGRRKAIIWTNAGFLFIGPLGTNFREILIEILTFSFKKMHLKVSSGKWRPFCLGLNVLNSNPLTIKPKRCHDVNYVVIGLNTHYLMTTLELIYDNLRCSRWWHNWHHDSSLTSLWPFFKRSFGSNLLICNVTDRQSDMIKQGSSRWHGDHFTSRHLQPTCRP